MRSYAAFFLSGAERIAQVGQPRLYLCQDSGVAPDLYAGQLICEKIIQAMQVVADGILWVKRIVQIFEDFDTAREGCLEKRIILLGLWQARRA